MGQYENRLLYEDKRKELVSYIFNCINDTMMEQFNLRYRTIQKSDVPYISGNVSVLEAQLYYNEELRTLYIYYIMDKNNRWGRAKDCWKMYTAIDSRIKNHIFIDEAVNVEFLGPCKHYDGKSHECSPNVTNILSSMVFTYWTWDGLDNIRNEFLTEKRLILHEYLKDPEKLPEFNELAEKINNKYNLQTNKDDYPLAFAEYQELFFNTFGKQIECVNDKIDHMYLLNDTDHRNSLLL